MIDDVSLTLPETNVKTIGRLVGVSSPGSFAVKVSLTFRALLQANGRRMV